MNPTTKEIIRLALANDNSIPPDITEAIFNLLEGRLATDRAVSANEPLLITMTAAAKLLGVSRVTIWRMVKDGDIRPIEITPNVFRIRRQDLGKMASRYTTYRPTRRGRYHRNISHPPVISPRSLPEASSTDGRVFRS